MSQPREMKRIPISAAKRIADDYGYDQVIVYARRVGDDPDPHGEHVTTYGADKAHCDVAARIGDHLIYNVFQWPREEQPPTKSPSKPGWYPVLFEGRKEKGKIRPRKGWSLFYDVDSRGWCDVLAHEAKGWTLAAWLDEPHDNTDAGKDAAIERAGKFWDVETE